MIKCVKRLLAGCGVDRGSRVGNLERPHAGRARNLHVFFVFCVSSLARSKSTGCVARCGEAAHANEGAKMSIKNRSGRIPRSPRANQNRAKIIKKSVRGAFGAIRDDSGRLRDGPGTLRRRSGTLSGRPETLSGCCWDAPGSLRDAPGTLSGRSRTLLGRLRHASGPFFRASRS